jgi:hypothetical protein
MGNITQGVSRHAPTGAMDPPAFSSSHCFVGGVEEVCASVSQRVPYLPPADSATATLSFDRTHHIGDMMNWTQI